MTKEKEMQNLRKWACVNMDGKVVSFHATEKLANFHKKNWGNEFEVKHASDVKLEDQ